MSDDKLQSSGVAKWTALSSMVLALCGMLCLVLGAMAFALPGSVPFDRGQSFVLIGSAIGLLFFALPVVLAVGEMFEEVRLLRAQVEARRDPPTQRQTD
jgi:hypothetical protein